MTISTHSALVLVDPYNDFLADDGAIWPLLKDVAEEIHLREHLQELVTAFRSTGRPAFYAPHRRWRPGDTAGWQQLGPVHEHLRDNHFYEFGTPGGEWYPALSPAAGDVVAAEHWGLSGFAGTDLDQQLRQHGVTHLVLAGLTAPGCVEGTGRYGLELGYTVTLVEDAVAAFTPDYQHAATRLTGPLYAREVTTTETVISRLTARATNSQAGPGRSSMLLLGC